MVVKMMYVAVEEVESCVCEACNAHATTVTLKRPGAHFRAHGCGRVRPLYTVNERENNVRRRNDVDAILLQMHGT